MSATDRRPSPLPYCMNQRLHTATACPEAAIALFTMAERFNSLAAGTAVVGAQSRKGAVCASPLANFSKGAHINYVECLKLVESRRQLGEIATTHKRTLSQL